MSDNVITINFDDYWYGVMLAGQGIGFEELSEDWPEVLLSEYAMRGYRAQLSPASYRYAWKRCRYGMQDRATT
jgi:hypothetical protein